MKNQPDQIAGFTAADRKYMRGALALGRRALGSTWPNPAVGCVVVSGGIVVARGWTQPGGRPHAERMALDAAGEGARGATAYVTLEPCSHYGKTPPCAQALIEAGITRCVIACIDRDQRVSGAGIAMLRAAGIVVEVGLCEAEAARQHAGFFKRVEHGLPLVVLKTATSLDGRVALADGSSKWITCVEARRLAHRLRACQDAIVIGSGTALVDDPQLTCRLHGIDQRPAIRVVLDGRGRLPQSLKILARQDYAPTWVVTRARRCGLASKTIVVPDMSPTRILRALAAEGITRVMIEGGPAVASSFLQAGVIDHLIWFRAARVMGGDARPVFADLDLKRLADTPAFSMTASRAIGTDRVEFYDYREL